MLRKHSARNYTSKSGTDPSTNVSVYLVKIQLVITLLLHAYHVIEN